MQSILTFQREGAFDSIPKIDVAPLRSGRGGGEDSREALRQVAAQIGQACRDVGFFYCYNHQIPLHLIVYTAPFLSLQNETFLSDFFCTVCAIQDEVYKQAKSFFSSPLDEKMLIAKVHNPEGHRGYFPLYEENTDPSKAMGDLKVILTPFFVRREILCVRSLTSFHEGRN